MQTFPVLAAFILVLSVTNLAAGQPRAEAVVLGDTGHAAVLALENDRAGMITAFYSTGKAAPLDRLVPIVIFDDDCVLPGVRYADGKKAEPARARLWTEDGSELAEFSINKKITARSRLSWAGQGILLWQLTLTNASAKTVSCDTGLLFRRSPTAVKTEFETNQTLTIRGRDGRTVALGLVAATAVRHRSAEKNRGPLAASGSELASSDALLTRLELAPHKSAEIGIVIALAPDTQTARERALTWMRLAASGKGQLRAKLAWQKWLAEGRLPQLADHARQQSLWRALRTVSAAAWHDRLAPRSAEALLDAAEAMQTYGRDAEATAYLALVAADARNFRDADTQARRSIALRYATLVSRQTIAGGRLAGSLDLVKACLDNASRNLCPTNGAFTGAPAEAVLLATALQDGALLTRLARDTETSTSLLSNATRLDAHKDDFFDRDSSSWTNADGLPDIRAISDPSVFNDNNPRFDEQYRGMRALADFLEPRASALLLLAAAHAGDSAWYGARLDAWARSSDTLPLLQRNALWLRVLGEGALTGCLAGQAANATFRLDTLYRTLLEMRHTSSDVAASFTFRDLRSQLRNSLGRHGSPDTSLLTNTARQLGALRDELERFALAKPLERRHTLGRFNRIDGILYAMTGSHVHPAATRVATDDTSVTLIVDGPGTSLVAPSGWRLVTRKESAGTTRYTLRPESGAAAGPVHARLTRTVHAGARALVRAETILIAHPRPLGLMLQRLDPVAGRLLLHNRGPRTLEIDTVQATPNLLEKGAPGELAPDRAGSLPLSLANANGTVRLLALFADNDKKFRIQKDFALSETLTPDRNWQAASGTAPGRFAAIDLDPEARFAADWPDRRSTLRKTLAAANTRGSLWFGIKSAEAAWTVLAGGRECAPVARSGWLWYDLGHGGSAVVELLFENKEGLLAFARAARRTATGTTEN